MIRDFFLTNVCCIIDDLGRKGRTVLVLSLDPNNQLSRNRKMATINATIRIACGGFFYFLFTGKQPKARWEKQNKHKCKTQNSMLGKFLTFVVWSSTVDCTWWVSGTPALGPMNSTHEQNNCSHHMECNSLEEKEGQGDLEKITRKRE